MVKFGDSWLWANDKKIIEKFNQLDVTEQLFFLIFGFLFSIKYFFYWSDDLWVVFWVVLFASRLNVLVFAFFFSKISWKVIFSIDRKIYFIFSFSVLLAIFVILFFPSSWSGISGFIEVATSTTTLSWAVYSILREEILYRFVFYYSLNRFFGRNIAFFTTVMAFSLMHGVNSSYYPFAVAPAGILFSIFSIATGSVLSSILLHFIFNVSIFIFVTYIL